MASETETTEDVQSVAVVAPKKQKKLKPARKQVKPGDVVKTEAPQTGKEYNIWYNKWAGGDREDSYSNKVKSQTRCNIKRDSGLTRANVTGIKYTCLYFAAAAAHTAGSASTCTCCPIRTTSSRQLQGLFRADKFSDYRDDMGGVGSFNRMNRTLYIGRIKETGNGLETEEVVMRHFKEWGQIEHDDSETGWAVKVLQYRSVAFVTYVSELHAQFAKEAMACQSMDNDEILNVRWATEDPNPVQKVAEKRRLVDMGQEVIKARSTPASSMPCDEDDGSGEPGAKRRRVEGSPSAPMEEEPPQPKGLLTPPPRAAAAPAPLKEGLGLADYGSEDED
ncbi:hypothetical protein K438DRAFT_2022546 [Mycena galopus ATCC 62051]|nr:hypothetical protein K438DRAFT_2022546 [Mycena galopus ATCC 62051]